MNAMANQMNAYNARAGYPAVGNAGQAMNAGCTFPAPPCKRVYCNPAPWSDTCGKNYHSLLAAYGSSREACGL
jgi:hypothetical protein